MVEWITCCNAKTYDLDRALREMKRIEWGQTPTMKGMKAGDILYLYITAPAKYIGWKCRVTDCGRQKSRIDDRKYSKSGAVYDGTYIEIEPIQEYTLRHHLTLDLLRRHGLKGSVRGARHVVPELSAYLRTVDELERSGDKQAEEARTMDMNLLKTVARQHADEHPPNRQYVSHRVRRDPYIAEFTKRRAGGSCQLCGLPAPFADRQGSPYLESHHVIWLSRGGADTIENTVALCPNCHARIHIAEDPKDQQELHKVVAAYQKKRKRP